MDRFFPSDVGNQPSTDWRKKTIQQRSNRNNVKTYSPEIETKMTYQYPKTRSFPFPQSIDHEKQTHKVTRELRQVPNQPIISEDSKEKRRQPFKVSEVPSPVRGYLKKKISEPIINKELLTERRRSLASDDHEIKKSRLVHDEYQGNDSKKEPDASISYEVDPIKEDNNISTAERDGLLKVRAKHKHEETQNLLKKSQEPYNVRMRPSDKKKLRDKKLWDEKQKQETVSFENEGNNKEVEASNESRIKSKPINREDNEHSLQVPLHLLDDPVDVLVGDLEAIEQQKVRLLQALEQFNVKAEIINVMQGPSVTRFEIRPEAGVKVSKVKNLSDDLKLSLAAEDIRIEAPIPGKHAIGIEIPNEVTSPVYLSAILSNKKYLDPTSPLTVGLGLDISGQAIITDIKKMPHGLIAGATGSGKSVCINTLLLSLLFKATPEEVRLLLIDPKMVELAPYNDLPHLVCPVINDVKAATQALKWAVDEMEDRYQQFVQLGARDIERFNEKAKKENLTTLPYIVIVIDELADLMMAAPQDVEDAICRIAQKARAAGIHLLLATQRPSVDVITGLIKSNIPTRIAFSVASQVDSRTMIDTGGAERLLGKGDMLLVESGARHPVRVQGAFVSDDEIDRVTRYIKAQRGPSYIFEEEQLMRVLEKEEELDDIYEEAIDFIVENDAISTSLLQRRFKIGYNRAARLIDTLEYQGIISAANGSKPRTLLLTKEEIEQLLKQ